MRIRALTLLLAALALGLCGCRVSGEVENQAYVLVLGMDRADDGSLTLTAKVPKIGKADKGKADEADGGGDYLLFSGGGADWPRALEALEQATPRQMNLSHIEMIVASEALAREAAFPALVSRVAETPHLYTTARFAVCEDRASDFIEAQETVIGTRLSSEINAMLDHYARQGFIPDSSFADAWYLAGSIYGDATAIHASLTEAQDDQPATMLISPSGAQRSPMRQRWSGTALFRGGVMVGALDAGETQLLNLIRGDADAFPFACDGRAYTLTPEGNPRLGADVEGGKLSVKLTLGTVDDLCETDAAALERELESALARLIRRCQALGTEPFGFSEAAASHFATVPDWLAFHWRDRYATAEVDVSVGIDA